MKRTKINLLLAFLLIASLGMTYIEKNELKRANEIRMKKQSEDGLDSRKKYVLNLIKNDSEIKEEVKKILEKE